MDSNKFLSIQNTQKDSFLGDSVFLLPTFDFLFHICRIQTNYVFTNVTCSHGNNQVVTLHLSGSSNIRPVLQHDFKIYLYVWF